MRVSVAIVAKHAEKTIKRAVESLLRQTTKPYEIIVVLDSLRDPTVEALEDLSLKVILNEGVGLGAARKTAVDASEGDIVAFIDADCIADKRWIESLVDVFSRSNVVVQEGKVIGVKALTDIPTTSLKLSGENSRSSNLRARITLDANVAFRKKELVNIIGNFDPWFEKGGEDVDFCIRLRKVGYRIHNNPNAKVYHLANRFTVRRVWRDGRSRAQAFYKHKGAIMGDALTCLFHIASLFGAILLLATGFNLLAVIFFAPSLLHRTYRATVSVRRGNSATFSLLNSLVVYISYLSFVIYLTKLMLTSLANLMAINREARFGEG